MEHPKKPGCPDCGPVPCNHFVEWNASLFCYFCTPFSRIGDWGDRRLFRPIRRLLSALRLGDLALAACVKLGIVKVVTAPDEKTGSRALVLWDEAKRRGIDMREHRPFGKSIEWFVASYGGKTIGFGNVPRPEGPMSPSLMWMDDKALMRKHFAKAGIPVARGGSCITRKGAHGLFHRIGAASIVKPGMGSRSRHTFVHINDDARLDQAAESAFRICPWIIVEQELKGMVHRVTLIGGTCFAVMRREPAFVTGNGKRTVKELMDEENKNPARQGPHFHEIPAGEDADRELARQNVTWDTVPEPGREVTLGDKVGRGNGGSNTDLTDAIHPENLKLFNKIADVLQDSIVGVDFIIEDMARPWQEQMPCGVIECNSAPFIDLHHFPLRGQVRNAAGAVWDVMFPASSGRAETIQSPKKA